jgi:hypothetical protein
MFFSRVKVFYWPRDIDCFVRNAIVRVANNAGNLLFIIPSLLNAIIQKSFSANLPMQYSPYKDIDFHLQDYFAN